MQPREQRFLTCMAFSVYEIVRVACHSRSDKRLTDDANEFVNAKTHTKEKPLLAGYDDAKGLAQQINRLLQKSLNKVLKSESGPGISDPEKPFGDLSKEQLTNC